MFVDASAIIAIIAQEDDWESLAARLAQASKIYVSPMAVWEAVVGLAREARIPFEDAEALLDRFVEETKAQMITISAAIGREAITASRLYGKGRHRANLNFGDCFAYACAQAYRLPLLFKGNDFVHTDITVA
jgi:ribonuclease VapC